MAESKALDPAITPEVRGWAIDLWNYHKLNNEISPSVDLLLVAGSHDTRVAYRGAELARSISFKCLVVSGGFGKITSAERHEAEADRFADIMIAEGVLSTDIRKERNARHMGENFSKTRLLLAGEDFSVKTGVVVTKPYMERRAFATAMIQWPEVEWEIASPGDDYLTYALGDASERRMIELMVGDLQRILVYPRRGIQIPQEIPVRVEEAFNSLVAAGFTAQVLVEELSEGRVLR